MTHSGRIPYGMIKRETASPKRDMAHRVSWELAYGPIPNGMHVLHRCDNGKCVNPDHLFLGTQTDNNADMDRKGRRSIGSHHPGNKLTEDNVLEIIDWRADGILHRVIARHFGVAIATIQGILAGKNWKHVKGAS